MWSPLRSLQCLRPPCHLTPRPGDRTTTRCKRQPTAPTHAHHSIAKDSDHNAGHAERAVGGVGRGASNVQLRGPAFNEPNEPGHTEASTTRMNVGGGHCCRNEGTFAFWGVCVCNLHVKLVDVYGRTFMVFMAREHVWCMHGSSFQICGGGRWARP